MFGYKYQFDLPKSLIWKVSKFSFDDDLPIRAANPLTKVSVPKPEVRRSRPHISTMAGDVTAHQAERKAPNMTETMTKAQYSSQNGIARGAIPPTP